MNDLMNRALRGDKYAENQLFEFLHVRFKAIAKHIIGGEQDSEDIAQDACTIVVTKYKFESFSSSFEAWTHGVLRKTIGNYLQRKRLEKNTFMPVEGVNYTIEALVQATDYELKSRLAMCTRQLITSYRRYARALNLIYQGYKVKEISKKMKISPQNLYVILNRGRSILRDCLEKGRV